MRTETSKSTVEDDEFGIFMNVLKDTSKDLNYFIFLLVGEFCFFATQDWDMRGS